eukprot:scaffold2267_cov187-Ochromonas_danica.AAC.10
MEGSGSSKSFSSSSIPKMTTSRIPQAGSRLPVASSRFASTSSSSTSSSSSSSSLATTSLERFEVKSLHLTSSSSSLGGTSSKSVDGMRPRLQTTRDAAAPPSVASAAVVAPPPATTASASTTFSTTASGRPVSLSRGVSDQRLRDVQSSVASAIESLSATTPTVPRNTTTTSTTATIDKIMTRGSQSEDNYLAVGNTGSQSLKTRLSLSPHPQYNNNRLGSPYNTSRIASSSLSGRATPISYEEDLKLLPALSADFQPATLAADVEVIYNRVFASGPPSASASADLLSIWGIEEGHEYQDGLFSDATTAQQLQRRQEEEVEQQGGYSMTLHSKRALNSEYFRLFDEEYLKNKDYYGPRLFFDLSST